MNIKEIFDLRFIKKGVIVSDKGGLFNMMVDDLFNAGIVTSKEIILKALWHREGDENTGIGKSIAVPHTSYDTYPELEGVVKEMKAVIYILARDLDYGSLDGNPVRIVCLLAEPAGKQAEHLKVLRLISKSLYSQENRDKLMSYKDEQEILNFFIGCINE